MAAIDMFRQRAVIEFLVKEGNLAGVIYGRLLGVCRNAYMGASSVRRFPRPARLWELSFGVVRDAYWSTFLEKGKTIDASRHVQTLNKLRRALREKRPKKKTLILQRDNAMPHTAHLTLQTTQKNGWDLLSHPLQSWIWPPQTTICSGP
jgi:hypothetical protein